MAFMLLFSWLFVIFAHIIGYPIIKYIYNKDDFFTWRTSLAGFIVYYIIIASILVFSIIFCCIYHICHYTIDKSSKQHFGVAAENLKDSDSKM